MAWDFRPRIELEEMTKEQLVNHIERELAWQRRDLSTQPDPALRKRIEELEHANYQQGYILDKMWDGLARYGKLDPKTHSTKDPRAVVNAFWAIVGDLKRFRGDTQEFPDLALTERRSLATFKETHQELLGRLSVAGPTLVVERSLGDSDVDRVTITHKMVPTLLMWLIALRNAGLEWEKCQAGPPKNVFATPEDGKEPE